MSEYDAEAKRDPDILKQKFDEQWPVFIYNWTN